MLPWRSGIKCCYIHIQGKCCTTTCSSIGAIVMTPLLKKLLAGQLVPVDAAVSFGKHIFYERLDAYILDYLKKKNLHHSASLFQAEGNVQTSSVAIDEPRGFLLDFWAFFWDVYSGRVEEKRLEEAAAAAAQIEDSILLEDPGATTGGQPAWKTSPGGHAPSSVLQGNLTNVQNWNQQHLGSEQKNIFFEDAGAVIGGQHTRQTLSEAPSGVLQENFQNFENQNQQHLESKQSDMDGLVGDGSLCVGDRVLEGFTLEEIQFIMESGTLACCHFSPDGKLFATGHSKMASLYGHLSNLLVSPVPFEFKFIIGVHSQWITDVRFSPSLPCVIATASADKTVKIWDVERRSSPQCSFTGHSETVLTLDFHPGKVDLLLSSDYSAIRCWNITNRECTMVKVSKFGVNQIRFEPSSGKLLAVASNNLIVILDGETLIIKDEFKGHIKDVHSVCWDSSGEFLASASDDSVRVWRVSEGKCVYKLETNEKKFNTCAFHPSHDCLLIIGCHKTLEIWNFLQNKLFSIPAHDNLVSCLAVSNVGGFMASGSHMYVKLWK